MPAYNEESSFKIIVPSSTGVLDDENYQLLTPKGYMLYDVYDKCLLLRNTFTETIDKKYDRYSILFSEISEAFGVRFCEIEGKPLDLVDFNLTYTYQNHYDNFNRVFDFIFDRINETNSKLEEVENALSSMHKRYLKRKQEVDTAFKNYNNKVKNEPHRSKYLTEELYDIAHKSWSHTCKKLKKEYESLDDTLKNDLDKSLSSLSITWYCEKRCG